MSEKSLEKAFQESYQELYNRKIWTFVASLSRIDARRATDYENRQNNCKEDKLKIHAHYIPKHFNIPGIWKKIEKMN